MPNISLWVSSASFMWRSILLERAERTVSTCVRQKRLKASAAGPRLAVWCLLLIALAVHLTARSVPAQTGTVPNTTPGVLRVYSTIYSVGVEWDVAGDANHNAAAQVEYRVAGSTTWKPALPLTRVDYNGANMLAGSLLFLNPHTTYQVKLALSDPDGGAETRVVTAATRRLPAPPVGGRIFHVTPGSGGGEGSAANPFRGIAAAQTVAQPGDTFLLRAGSYGGRIRFDKAGTAASYLVWKGAGDGEVLINGVDIAASHLWLEGLTVRNQGYATFSINAPENVVVTRCHFYNNHYSIYLQQGGKDWYIADNVIVGDTPASSESFSGEGIELNITGGHTVAHNSITNVADGISYPSTNVDIFGNDIFDTSDDGIEADYGGANVRMWGNRIHNAVHNAISFQPQNGAPWYVVRNQLVSSKESPFKFRTTDRFVLLHNTIVNWAKMMCCSEDHLLRAYARNNLWISSQGEQIWWFGTTAKDWRTDLDYDGFDWGSSGAPFVYGGVGYSNLSAFAAASGLERNGRQVSKSACFETFNIPGPAPTSIPAQVMTLKAGCAALDAGTILPGINDSFAGIAPDMGAYEYGQPAPSYGPRTGPTATLTASPSAINSGQSSTLSWATTEATTVGIDQGIGGLPTSGSTVVTPAATTTYTLTATGPSGVTTASVTVTVAADADVTPPSAPTNLTAQAVSPSQVNLSWTASSDDVGVAGYKIFRHGQQIATSTMTTFSDAGLNPSTTYTYNVSAFDAAANNSAPSQATVVNTPGSGSAPVANNDGYGTNKDVALIVAAPGVLSNDADADGNPLTAVLISGPTHGTLTLNANGSFVYTPAAGYSGADSFTYRANDGTANSNTATVTLTVNSVNNTPKAVNDSATTSRSTPVTITVLANDSDPDGDMLNVAQVTQGGKGSVTINANQTVTYAPARNFKKGTDTFTYTISDGRGGTASAAVTVQVQ